jgi:hypothetical protein
MIYFLRFATIYHLLSSIFTRLLASPLLAAFTPGYHKDRVERLKPKHVQDRYPSVYLHLGHAGVR